MKIEIQKLVGMNPALKCAFCGSQQMAAVEDVYLPHRKNGAVHIGAGADVVGLACRNCGHLSLHAKEFLE